MKIKILAVILALLPCMGFSATRDGSGRTGIRAPSLSIGPAVNAKNTNTGMRAATVDKTTTEAEEEPIVSEAAETIIAANVGPEECRAAYRECMDDFCLLDESEGGRCACSDNIKQSKSLIQEIQEIELAAEKQYTEGVEREKLGAKAKFVRFGESDQAKKSSRRTGIDLVAWINGGGTAASLDADDDIGDNLYDMAADSCNFVLEMCETRRAEMEEKLYQREVTKDCKNFSTYLAEQKRAAESNKRTADAAVRAAQAEMIPITNKYNRGECRQALRACVADKGGCGVDFENCLDAKLLERRTLSCENVLDQCMKVRNYVLEDWAEESKEILKQAAIDADKNMRQTCYTKIRACLEEGCSVSIDFGKSDGLATNSGCLNNVNIAAGVCPIIDECNQKVPGIKASVNDLLASLRTDFCQNDVDKCLRNKCGENFTAPQCVGKSTKEITDLCPQKMIASCKGEKSDVYNIIVSSVLLQMNYQMVQGCINYYADALGKICGTDMNCLPNSIEVAALKTTPQDLTETQNKVITESKTAVDEFFKRFETEATVSACKSAQQPAGRKSLKDSIFVFAKQAAQIAAQNRYLADLDSKLNELSRAEDVTKAEQNCYARYQVEKKKSGNDDKTSYSYIKSVSFEPSLRNCHVCRMQRVCEVGGESKGVSAAKYAFGGIASGGSLGTLAGGYGALIGAAAGGVLGAVGGIVAGGEQTFCQEVESCEDINM